ncbi:MAG: tol-pal system protein YbgF [bacterium]
MKKIKAWSVLIILLSLVVGCASMQDIVVLKGNLESQKRQIANIKTEMDAVRGELKTGFVSQEVEVQTDFQGMREQIANLQVMVDLSRDENRKLSAKLEDYNQLVNRQVDTIARFKNQIEQLRYRVENLEDQLEGFLKNFSQTSMKGALPSEGSETKQKEEEIYQAAYQSFISQDYLNAQKKFKTFLEDFPQGKLADNAQFWIGECEYKMGNYEQAIIEYEKVKTNYPKGNKVPAAILKQAKAFLQLERKKDAKAILTQLIEEYPDTNEAENARKQMEQIK